MKRMLPTRVFTAGLCFLVLFSSCATILSDNASPVYFHTDPEGATIDVTDKKGREVYHGHSPSRVILKSGAGYFSKASYTVTISSKGYEDRIVKIDCKLNGWYFGNLLLGGVVGMLIVDPVTGAMWKIKDPVVDETLDKSVSTSLATPTLKIVDIKDLTKESRENLIRLTPSLSR